LTGVYTGHLGKGATQHSGYRANKTISVVCPDIITAIIKAHEDFKKDYNEITVIAATHSGVVNLVTEETEWRVK